jgi:hypothetical protein
VVVRGERHPSGNSIKWRGDGQDVYQSETVICVGEDWEDARGGCEAVGDMDCECAGGDGGADAMGAIITSLQDSITFKALLAEVAWHWNSDQANTMKSGIDRQLIEPKLKDLPNWNCQIVAKLHRTGQYHVIISRSV